VADRWTAGEGADEASASVVIAGEEFEASPTAPFVFGRDDGSCVVGLDANDMGISAVAGSVEFAWGVWWIVNQSTKRPLRLEHAEGPGHLELAPGHRFAVTTERVNVLVAGAIYTHVLEVVLPHGYAAALRGGEVSLTERERDALTALFAGYLEPFPRRREHPHTYEKAARLLGTGWTGDRVRKAAERVKARFAAKHSLYFEGPQANYDLAAHLISSGILSGDDLRRLSASAYS
jgi:hypothetical protein